MSLAHWLNAPRDLSRLEAEVLRLVDVCDGDPYRILDALYPERVDAGWVYAALGRLLDLDLVACDWPRWRRLNEVERARSVNMKACHRQNALRPVHLRLSAAQLEALLDRTQAARDGYSADATDAVADYGAAVRAQVEAGDVGAAEVEAVPLSFIDRPLLRMQLKP